MEPMLHNVKSEDYTRYDDRRYVHGPCLSLMTPMQREIKHAAANSRIPLSSVKPLKHTDKEPANMAAYLGNE